MSRNERQNEQPPIGVTLATDVEELPGRRKPFRGRVRWTDQESGDRRSLSRSHATAEDAAGWVVEMQRAAAGGVGPTAAPMGLGDDGRPHMTHPRAHDQLWRC